MSNDKVEQADLAETEVIEPVAVESSLTLSSETARFNFKVKNASSPSGQGGYRASADRWDAEGQDALVTGGME